MQKDAQRILIIRPGALGDTLVVFPILQHLQALSPQTHITMIGNATVLPLIQALRLADEVGDFEELLWSRLFMQPGSRNQSLLYTRLQHIDRAICWLTDGDDLVKHNLQAAGIPIITIAPARPTTSLPIVSYLAQSIGEDPETIYWRTPTEYLWQKGEPAEPPARAIAIHPGSGGQQKCWPITHFATIITELWQHNIPVLLLAGSADHDRINGLLKLLPEPRSTKLLHLLQDAPLLTVAQELRHCQSYLGNDAGISHLAALIGMPTLVIFGPSDPIIWKPIGSTVLVVKTADLDKLAPQAVYTQLMELTARHKG